MGVPFGYVETQAALALNGVERTEMLSALLRIVAKSAATEPFGNIGLSISGCHSAGRCRSLRREGSRPLTEQHSSGSGTLEIVDTYVRLLCK